MDQDSANGGTAPHQSDGFRESQLHVAQSVPCIPGVVGSVNLNQEVSTSCISILSPAVFSRRPLLQIIMLFMQQQGSGSIAHQSHANGLNHAALHGPCGPMWTPRQQQPAALLPLGNGQSVQCNSDTASTSPRQQQPQSDRPVKPVHRGGRRKAWIHQQFNPTSGLCSHCGDIIRSRDATVKKTHLLNPRKCRCGV